MVRRLIDAVVAGVLLLGFSPLLGLAAIGIKLSSRGPVFYRARRVGQHGRLFTMYKLRTMHVAQEAAGSITAANDARVFLFGNVLRQTKIDELPQLWNIVRGEMSFIGPRAEDPDIVERHYAPDAWETLSVRPGLSSPGSLYYYTHSEQALEGEDIERMYLQQALPIKLAIDTVYIRHATWAYDLRVACRTVSIIMQIMLGRRSFPEPPEMAEARGLLAQFQPVRMG